MNTISVIFLYSKLQTQLLKKSLIQIEERTVSNISFLPLKHSTILPFFHSDTLAHFFQAAGLSLFALVPQTLQNLLMLMITAKTSASIINFPKNKMKETRYNSSSTKIHTHFYVEYTIFQELHSATEAEESQSSKTFSDLTVISNSSESLNCEPDLLSKLKCSPKSFLSMGIKQLLSALYCRCCHLQ